MVEVLRLGISKYFDGFVRVRTEAQIPAGQGNRERNQQRLRSDLFINTLSFKRHVDVALVNPACKSHQVRELKQPIVAMERIKFDKYRNAGVDEALLTPFVLDLTGNLGSPAENLLNELADLIGKASSGKAFASFVRRRLSIAVAKGVAKTSFSHFVLMNHK